MRLTGFTVLMFLLMPAIGQGIFRDLTAVQFGDSILLNWTLTAGNTCFDMHLQRAEDDMVFSEIYSVGGVCGGTQNQYYDFIDNEWLRSGTQYAYKVTASNDTYTSDTVMLTFIDAGKNHLFIFPNPADATVNITVDNQYTPTFLCEVYDMRGAATWVGQRNQNAFSLDISGWLPGLYLIKITTRDGRFFSTPLIVR